MNVALLRFLHAAGIEKFREIGGVGVVLIAAFRVERGAEFALLDLEESRINSRIVGIEDIAVVVCRVVDAVELEMSVALAGGAAHVAHDVPAVVGFITEQGVDAAGPLGPAFEFRLNAVDVRAVFGDDVDDAEHRVGAVKRRAGAANDFDAVHGLHGDDEILVDVGLIVNHVAGGPAVHQHQDACVPFIGPQEA